MQQVCDNNIITIIRGDNFDYIWTFVDDMTGEKIIPTENDELYMGVMQPGEKFEDAILKKKATKLLTDDAYDGRFQFQLDSPDTLMLRPGKYYYSLKYQQIINDKEIVTTILPNTLFWIEE